MSNLSAIASEEYLIGAALIEDRTVFTHILEHIEGPEDFYRGAHKDAWRTIIDLYRAGKGIDVPIVTQQLPDDSRADRMMLNDALLSVAATDAATISTHALIVREKALARRVDKIARTASQEIEKGEDVFTVLDTMQSGLLQTQRAEAGTSTTASEGAQGILERMERRSEGELDGIRSGLQRLDMLTGGWKPGELTVLAARPSMGKTSLALHIGSEAAKSGHRVGIFSVEMKSGSLFDRLAASEAGVNLKAMQEARLTEEESGRVFSAAATIAELPMVIDDRSVLTPLQARSRAHEWAMDSEGIDLLIIDYLQIMKPGVDKGTREQEVAHMSREIKAMAQDLDVPVILLSQLNRRVEQRPKKRPQLSDLRASGAIEQDADLVAMLYRPEYYDIDTDDQGRSTRGVAFVDIAKQRNGPTGSAAVHFEKKTGAWANLSGRDEPHDVQPHQGDGATDSAPF